MYKKIKRVTGILRLATKKFFSIEGGHRSAAFAFYTFLSLFPLIILFVTIASAFFSADNVSEYVFNYIGKYMPISLKIKEQIFNTIYGVIIANKQIGIIAFLGLMWGSIKFLNVLVNAVNKAWHAHVYKWWKLPIKSLMLFGLLLLVVFFGITAPILARMISTWLFHTDIFPKWMYSIVVFFIPFFVLFFSLSLFYKIASLRKIKFSKTWPSSLFVTLLFMGGQILFVFFSKHFFNFNAVYGTLGGIIALLMWIYFSGYIFIFGACLCVSHSEKSK